MSWMMPWTWMQMMQPAPPPQPPQQPPAIYYIMPCQDKKP